jgi:hypothetical protein
MEPWHRAHLPGVAAAFGMMAGPQMDRRRRGARPVHLPLRHHESAKASPAGGEAAPTGEGEGDAPVSLVSLSSQILISLMAGPQLHAPHRESWGQVSRFQGWKRPVHLPLRHQLLQQALERRPQVRVRRLSAREPRRSLQKQGGAAEEGESKSASGFLTRGPERRHGLRLTHLPGQSSSVSRKSYRKLLMA